MEKNHHFLLLCYPVQSNINPTLQLAKQLTRAGARVTLVTTVHGLTQIRSFPTHNRLFYASFSDGYDQGRRPGEDDIDTIIARGRQVGSATLSDLINSLSEKGTPVTMLIYTMILPWAAAVARDFNLPTAFFCAQSATSFAIYQKYFKLDNFTSESSIKLPGLPSFTSDGIPSFLLPTGMFHFLKPVFKEHIQVLEQDPDAIVLINTFTALEKESIQAIDHFRMIPIGPLIPSAFSDETDPSDRFYGIDLFEESNDYLQWLDSKPSKSVIYISFGSLASLKKRQVEELLNGLVDCKRAFLWVMRTVDSDEEIKTMVEDGMRNAAAAAGLVVPWCSQVEVLNHVAIGCFLSHCGWNSTMESLMAGVPMVAFPQFMEQVTNAKMVEEVWGVGVKAKAKEKEEEMVVGREEMKRCLDIVMEDGEKGKEIRDNVCKWRDLALEAVKEGGSSHKNFKHLLHITI